MTDAPRCACGNKGIKGRGICWRCDKNLRAEKRIEEEMTKPGRLTMRTRHRLTTGPIPAFCGHCAFQGRSVTHKCHEPTMETRGLAMPAHEARIRGLCPLVLRGAA